MDKKSILVIGDDEKQKELIQKLNEDGFQVIIHDGTQSFYSKEELLHFAREIEFPSYSFEKSPYSGHENYIQAFQQPKKPRR